MKFVVATITFDTLKFVEKPRAVGVPEEQAKAGAEALAEAMDSQLATKTVVNRLARELILIKWIIGLVLGGTLALILKTFFPV
jgi:hypothetical protein